MLGLRRRRRSRSRGVGRRSSLALRGSKAGALRRAAPLTRHHSYPLVTYQPLQTQAAPDGPWWEYNVFSLSSPPRPTSITDPTHPMILYNNKFNVSLSVIGPNGPGEFLEIQFFMIGDTAPRAGINPNYADVFKEHTDDRDKITTRPNRYQTDRSRFIVVPVKKVTQSWGLGGAATSTLKKPTTAHFTFSPPPRYAWSKFEVDAVPDPSTVSDYPVAGTSWFLASITRFLDGADTSQVYMDVRLNFQWKGY